MVKRRKTGTVGGNQKSRLQLATLLLHSDNQRLHLTIREVEQLLQATKGSRNEDRDRCLVLLAFRHGLRVSEACHLNLDQVDIYSRVLHVHRLKNGLSTDHLCSAINPFTVEPTSCQQMHNVVTSRVGRRYIGDPPNP